MNDIEYIQYGIKELGNSYELHNQEWAKRILKEMNNSLENLLNRIKDLEEINEAHKKENGELREREKDLQKSVDQIYDDYQDIGKMYFNLTEKIEKKIEELKKEYKIALEENSTKAFILKCQIQVLEELLKGE